MEQLPLQRILHWCGLETTYPRSNLLNTLEKDSTWRLNNQGQRGLKSGIPVAVVSGDTMAAHWKRNDRPAWTNVRRPTCEIRRLFPVNIYSP